MAVYVNNITLNTGEYFSRDFYLDNIDGTPLDLTGYTAASQMRKHPESVNATADFNVGFIDRANGRIRVSLATTTTRLVKPGRYVWDVMFTDSSNKKSIVIEGNVLATPDITPSCVKTDYTYDRLGVIIESSSKAGSAPAVTGHDNIGINDITDYGVVHMGVNFNQCSTFDVGGSTTRDLLEDASSLEKINQYLQLGGVVWFNTEWWGGSASGRACSDRDNINAMLTLLGTEIRTTVDQGFVGNADRSSEVSVINSGFPLTENHNASVIFTGGTPVYTIESGTKVLSTYEKIGQGILFVQGDSNIFPGPAYPENYYNALRALVLNS
tara:strand:+ start:487 stop:1464 length:978 start_codon:yes stop_codon:yes gene_type:complete